MILLYNFIQVVFIILFWPLIIIFLISQNKYRRRILSRLGFGLTEQMKRCTPEHPTYWIHALSVGEMTSAVPLVTGLRQDNPECNIVISATTRTGRANAEKLFHNTGSIIIDGPVDIWGVVRYFIKKIHPDLFIQVETDFWPNQLYCLRHNHIPSFLVNGRISARSIKSYSRFGFFFRPMFSCFSHLCMQSAQDKKNMIRLGIPASRISTLGNLKFDVKRTASTQLSIHLDVGSDRKTVIAGSTHRGEERILLDCYCKLVASQPDLLLVIAPRDIGRSEEIASLARDKNLKVSLLSSGRMQDSDIIIIDSLGLLADLYGECDIAFVGGSMVACGGHNPLEPAGHGIPVLFGSHMEDFHEIAAELIQCGGARQVANGSELQQALFSILKNEAMQKDLGEKCLQYVRQHRGVIAAHITLFKTFL